MNFPDILFVRQQDRNEWDGEEKGPTKKTRGVDQIEPESQK